MREKIASEAVLVGRNSPDAFHEHGCRRLATSLLRLAACDLAFVPSEMVRARNWILEDPPGRISFSDCVAELGLEAWTEQLREMMLSHPKPMAEHLLGYQRSVIRTEAEERDALASGAALARVEFH